MMKTFVVAAVLVQAAPPSFAAATRAVNFKVIPPSAVVGRSFVELRDKLRVVPRSLMLQYYSSADEILKQGPVVVVQSFGAVIMVPRTVRPGDKALIMTDNDAKLVPLTKKMITGLREQLSVKKDKHGAVEIVADLSKFWDGSAKEVERRAEPVWAGLE